jgi:hypothetical protein
MNPDEDVRCVGHVAHHHCDMLDPIDEGLIGVDGEIAMAGRKARLRQPLYEWLGSPAMPDKIGNAQDFQVMRPGEFLEVRTARHRAIVVDDLCENSGGIESGCAREVDRGFGGARAAEHAAFDRSQRKDVAGPREIRRLGIGMDQSPHGGGAIGRRDAGRRPVTGIDRDRERGPPRLIVVGRHQGQTQLIKPLSRQRGANHPAGVADHESHGLWRDALRRHDEVALAHRAFVGDEDDDPAPRERRDGLLDPGDGHRGAPWRSRSGIPDQAALRAV